MKPGEFKEFLKERFGLELPKKIQLFRDKGSAIRVASISSNSIVLNGSKGFVAHSKKTGLSNDFIQLFGKRAKKGSVQLTELEALKFANGEKITKKIFIKKGPVIISYKGHILGVATFDGRILHPKVKGKRRRKVWNKIEGIK